jgi:hypothetical protein
MTKTFGARSVFACSLAAVAILFIAFPLAAPEAAVETNFWLGLANVIGPWSDGNSWFLGHPGDGAVENVVISQGTVIGDFSFNNVNTVTLDATTDLRIQSTTTITNAGTVQSQGTVTNGGTFTNGAGGLLAARTSMGNGLFTNDTGGTLTNAVGGSLSIDTFVNNAGGTFINNGAAGALVGDSIFNGFNALTNAGVLSNNAGASLAGTNLANATGGTFTNAGTIFTFGPMTNAGALTNAAGGMLSVRTSGLNALFTNAAGGTLTNAAGGTLSIDVFVNNAGGTVINNGAAGALVGDSIFNGFNALTNAGALTNGAGASLAGTNFTNAAGGTFTNAGTFFTFSPVTNAGTVTNAAGGTFSVRTAGLNGLFTNAADGTLINAAGGTLNIDVLRNNAGGTFINSGIAGVLMGSTIQNGFQSVTNAGTLTNNAGASLASAVLTNAAGGTLTNAGTLGTFGFTNNGTFVEEISGTGPGHFGQLLSFNITLGGVLDVALLDGFTPASGDTFAFIGYTGTRTGMFGSEILPALLPGLSWTLTYDDVHRDVVLEVTGTATNVPEPATLALVAGGIVGLGVTTAARRRESRPPARRATSAQPADGSAPLRRSANRTAP